MDDDEFPDEPRPFTIPLPPPPPAMQQADYVFFRRPGPGVGHGPGQDPSAPRDTEDIMLRRVPAAVAMRFRAAAGGRGMTHAQYLAALVGLHEAIRTSADDGNAELAATLERLGLQTVSI
jgi:hypothetical protein